MPFDWTDEREAELKKQWLAGVPRKEIAAGFGVSENAIAGKTHRMGLRRDREAVAPGTLQKKVVKRIRAAKKEAQKAADEVAEKAVKAVQAPPKVKAKAPEITLAFGRPWHTRAIGQCAYPIGERGPWGFADIHSCCARVLPGKSYCPGHHREMFQPISNKRGTIPFKIRIGKFG